MGVHLEHSTCAAIVLGAGGSSRLGTPKQLVRFRGQTLIARSINNALAVGCSPVFTVLGANHEEIQQELIGLQTVAVSNTDWAEGMGSSISAGMNALVLSDPSAEAVLITLCDQPLITRENLLSLAQIINHRESLVVASEYQVAGRMVRGVPAIFSAQLFSELGSLRGAEGAKSVIMRHESRATFVEIPEAAFDLDTPDDYESLRAME